MTVPEDLPLDVPFSLCCLYCDAGDDLDTYDEAIAEGWTDIHYAPDGLSSNFVGLCPACRREHD